MSDIQELERQIDNAEKVVAQRDKMVKLSENKEFKELIIDGFCSQECARYVHLSTDPNLSASDRADALGSAQAAGHLKRFINAIIMMGNQAAREIPQAHEALEEARAENGDE